MRAMYSYDGVVPTPHLENTVRYDMVTSCEGFTATDEIHEVKRKADCMLGVILNEGSLAVATRHPNVVKALDPGSYAETLMERPYELAVYRIWKLGVPLRAVDWAQYTERAPIDDHGGRSAKKWGNLALNLRAMYKRQEITADQAYSWMRRHNALMPLVKAIARVRKAQLDACGGVAGRDPRLFVELQAVNEQKRLLNRCLHVATQGRRIALQSLIDGDGVATINAVLDALTDRQIWLRNHLGLHNPQRPPHFVGPNECNPSLNMSPSNVPSSTNFTMSRDISPKILPSDMPMNMFSDTSYDTPSHTPQNVPPNLPPNVAANIPLSSDALQQQPWGMHADRFSLSTTSPCPGQFSRPMNSAARLQQSLWHEQNISNW